MTNLADFDRALADFLEDGPNTAPEAPVIAALAHARTTPRRPDPLGRFRSDVMTGGGWRLFGLRPALALGVLALVAAGIGITVLGSRPSDQPSVIGPSPTSAVPTPAPTPVPSPLVQRSASPALFSRDITMLVSAGDPFPIHVSDTTGDLIDATSLQPGDGASVDQTTIQVVVDPSDPAALIVTWQGTPCETGASLNVIEQANAIEIGRQDCQGDALPLDRIVRLQFDRAIANSDVSSTFLEFPSASRGPVASGTPTSQGPLGAPAVPPIHVALLHDSGNAVSIDVVDESGLVVKAVSGAVPATDPVHQFDVANDSPSVLRLTWEGSPCDTVHRLTIDPTATDFTIDRPFCGGDAMPAVRSLVLTFSRPVDAATLTTAVVAGRGGVDMPNWTVSAPDSVSQRYDLTLADPGYVVNTIEGFFDPGFVPADPGPSGIKLTAGDANTFHLVWLGQACATTPELAISPDGSAWQIVDEPCTTSAPDVVRMVDVGLALPNTTATVPSIVKVSVVAP